jgi:ABC-type antimicrobial peptide transport system permease subunit
VGIMPELTMKVPIMLGSQFDSSAKLAGISTNFPEAFGSFYDWKTGNKINIGDYLTDNTTILMSSRLAENLGLDKGAVLPIQVTTEFTNLTVTVNIDPTNGTVVATPTYSVERIELTISGIYDSNRPGIGSRYRGMLMSLENLQEWRSLEDVTHETDYVGSYLIALKTDHFTTEIDEAYLQEQVDLFEASVPENVYSLESNRLTFFSIAEIIMTLLSTMLTALGLLIMITGVLLITNVQLMNVEDREFQTGVLRAVGENRRGIFQ